MEVPVNRSDRPNEVWARVPTTVEVAYRKLMCNPDTLRIIMEDLGSEAKLGEYVGLVHGNYGTNTSGLRSPTAVFRGLKRPMHFVNGLDDDDVFVYVTNPAVNYAFPRANKFNGEGPVEAVKPVDSVFTTFVSFHPDHVDEALKGVQRPEDTKGVVLFWEWTEASVKTPRLPFDFDIRYGERVL